MYQDNFVGPGYFETMGIPVDQGTRVPHRSDRRGAPPSIVVNEEFARRYFADSDPLGQA